MADIVAAGVEAVGTVQLRAPQQMHPEFAQVADATDARLAPTACGDEAHHHGIALGDVGDPVADLYHHAGTFVTADHRHSHLQVAGDQMFVGVAHAARRHLDHHLAAPGTVEVNLLDLPLLVQSPQNGGLRLHRRLLLADRRCGLIHASLADFRP